ncbi:MAG: hypothetical protein ABL986_06620 [Vicinamibacterales bacterium]
MKIVFSSLHFADFRSYESVVRGLAERGHHVHVVAEEPESFGGHGLVERLGAEHPTVTWGRAPSPASEIWFPFAQTIRYALDHVRFLGPENAAAEKLRIRNLQRTPRVSVGQCLRRGEPCSVTAGCSELWSGSNGAFR